MPLSVDDLLSKFEEEEETFQFAISTGDTLTARRPKAADELLSLEKTVAKVVKTAEKRPPPNWAPYLPASEAVIRMALYAEAFMVDPVIDFVTGLRMGKTCGFLLPEIGAHLVTRAQEAAGDAELDGVEQIKNDFGAEQTTDAP